MIPKQGVSLSKLLILIPFLVAGLISSAQPIANFSANNTSGCAPLTVHFTDQSSGSPTSWSWDFGNGQLSTARNPTITYAKPGTYTVRLIIKDSTGVDDEIKTDYITVFSGPVAAFSSNLTTSCAPAPIQFTDHSTTPAGSAITSWLWDFGDGSISTLQNPNHTYNDIGFYTVTLKVKNNNGCTSTSTIGRYIRIVSGVNVNFTYNQPTTCQAPFFISFLDQSSGPGNLSYSWNFGNGATSTLQNPSFTFNTAGTYPVRLNVKSDLGCTGTITQDVVVAGKTTDFTFPSSICIAQSINFQNASTPAPISSSWDFGDGTTSSQINPVKTFLSGGTFYVKLINNYGNCSDTVAKDVTVITSPTVDFSTSDTVSCDAPVTVHFADKSPLASTWHWDFGDGSTSTEQNPNHTYNDAGFYDVTLSITLAGGCSNTITKTQYIKIRPITTTISNAPAGGCAPYTFTPMPNIQSIDSVVSYSWDLGESGAVYNTKSPTHTYNSVGNYIITLTITTKSGCVKTVTVPNGVLVGTKPTANFNFTPDNACASDSIHFTDNSTTTPGSIVEWSWDFGDGETSNLKDPVHQYQDTGALVVKLIVSNNGCPDLVSKTVHVLPPVAKFGYKIDCNDHLTVAFSDSSLASPTYGPVTYQWDFGDGTTSSSKSPAHTYSSLGTYNVTLTVTNGACSYHRSKTLILTNEPADFTISKNIVCSYEDFTLSAMGNTANIVRYTWLIGSTTLTSENPTITHSFPFYGSYDVSLTVEDVNGCVNTKTVANYITVNGPLANFSSDLGNCIDKQVNFSDLSATNGVPITEWNWDFGDGTQQTFTSPPFSHTYSQTGSYTVTLTVKNSENCENKFWINNVVLITDPLAGFRSDTFYCPSAPLQFVDTSIGLRLKYDWDFGDGGTSTLQNPVHSFNPGIYSVKLTITDTVGCKDSVLKTNYVNIKKPTAAFDITDSSGICLPLVTSFTFKGIDYKTLLWDFGDGGTSSLQDPSHFYNDYGSYIAKLYLFGPGLCVDSGQATVNVYNPVASTQITPSTNVACNSASIDFNLITPPGFNYKLYFGDGEVDSSQQANITHFYASPGNYLPFIIYSDKFGCEPRANGSTINVYGSIPLFDKSKKEFCDSGTVSFKNFTISNDPVVSTVWDFGDGNTSVGLQASHTFTAPGTYKVTLTVTTQQQCTNSYSDTIRVYKTPEISITGKDTICINGVETFNGLITVPDSTIQWLWTFGNGNTSNAQSPSVPFSSQGDYNIQLIGENKLGCSDTAFHAINVVPLPTATAVTNPISIISGASATLNMNYTGPIISYNWLPTQHLDCIDCPQPVANPQFSTDYTVQVQDRFGCKNSGNVSVKVLCNGENFFIPNTFSPNGDGINDVFYLRGSGLFRVNSLMIFNRWGEIVFEKKNLSVNDPSSGWDGNYKGRKAKPDVYVYQIEIVCSNGEVIKYSGNIALIQ